MELLAVAASTTWPTTSTDVDESFLCGSPGKVMEPYVLHDVLKVSAEQQVFFGTSTKKIWMFSLHFNC